jgi:putative flippase GtrA
MANQFWQKLKDNQVVKFILSAGVGFLVDISTFHIFITRIFPQKSYQVVGFAVGNYTLSLAVSFVLGVIVNFLMTRYIVFSESKLPAYKQFLRFALVASVGFFANLYILRLFVHVFDMNPSVARILAALSLFFASFFVHKFFSFSLSLRHHHGHQPGQPRSH